jgi:hypothetical protein
MTPARELRFAFVFDDYDAALHLFSDVFGLDAILDHSVPTRNDMAARSRSLCISAPDARVVVREERRWT